jgi:glycosyltransferase involved in cell wall biosynthesis
MAASMAIITTKGTGCEEVVGDTALLVKSRDPTAIREALTRLIGEPDLCKELGKAARERLENNFNWTVVAKQYADLYDRYAHGH